MNDWNSPPCKLYCHSATEHASVDASIRWSRTNNHPKYVFVRLAGRWQHRCFNSSWYAGEIEIFNFSILNRIHIDTLNIGIEIKTYYYSRSKNDYNSRFPFFISFISIDAGEILAELLANGKILSLWFWFETHTYIHMCTFIFVFVCSDVHRSACFPFFIHTKWLVVVCIVLWTHGAAHARCADVYHFVCDGIIVYGYVPSTTKSFN